MKSISFSGILHALSWKGRLRRKTYFLRLLLIMLLLLLLGKYTEHPFFNVLILALLIIFFTQTIQRLHDLNLSGWWSALVIVPIVNLLFGSYVILRKGASGDNPFGKDPRVK